MWFRRTQESPSPKVKNNAGKLSQSTSVKLGYPDSNQKRQDQNLQCYHYTIPQENGKWVFTYALSL